MNFSFHLLPVVTQAQPSPALRLCLKISIIVLSTLLLIKSDWILTTFCEHFGSLTHIIMDHLHNFSDLNNLLLNLWMIVVTMCSNHSAIYHILAFWAFDLIGLHATSAYVSFWLFTIKAPVLELQWVITCLGKSSDTWLAGVTLTGTFLTQCVTDRPIIEEGTGYNDVWLWSFPALHLP